MRREPAFLLDVLEAAHKIVSFTKDIEYTEFLQDEKLQLAVQKLIEIIGEAARNVSPELKSEYPNIPWKEMVGMRDVLVHQYFRVNLARIWEAARCEVPGLIELIEPLVPPEEP
jgi:uncharacterized protein with HEPN domain